MPGASKLDHLQSFQKILLSKFSIFSSFILGAISYYPRGPIIEGLTQLQIWIRQMNFTAWGVQTRPLVSHSAHFVLKSFVSYSSLYWGDISYYLQRDDNTGKGLQRCFAPRQTVWDDFLSERNYHITQPLISLYVRPWQACLQHPRNREPISQAHHRHTFRQNRVTELGGSWL